MSHRRPIDAYRQSRKPHSSQIRRINPPAPVLEEGTAMLSASFRQPLQHYSNFHNGINVQSGQSTPRKPVSALADFEAPASQTQTPLLITSPVLASSPVMINGSGLPNNRRKMLGSISNRIEAPLLEADDGFMTNVHHTVNNDDLGSTGEERTPSPFIPGSVPGPSSPPSSQSILGLPVASGRVTRSRDAKETEQAIAAVQALEARSTSVPRALNKGKGKARATPSDEEPLAPEPISLSSPSSSSASQSQGRHSSSPALVPSTPPRTKDKHLFNLSTGVGIAESPSKGRRIHLVRPASVSERHDSTSPFSSSPVETKMSDPIIQWLNTPSPKKPTIHRPGALQRTNSQVERDWNSIDLGALAITIPSSSQRNAADPSELLRLFNEDREVKKRKRLDAFKDDSSGSSADDELGGAGSSVGDASTPRSRGASVSSSTSKLKLPLRSRSPNQQSPLKAAHVEGLGRMAVHPGDLRGARVVTMADVENRMRVNKTLFGMDVQEDLGVMRPGHDGSWGRSDSPIKLANAASAGSIPWTLEGSQAKVALQSSLDKQGPQWPDAQLPWSTNNSARRKRNKRSRMERQEIVERFLDRDSDSDSGDGSPTAGVSKSHREEAGVVAGARGLWALGQDKPPPPIEESPVVTRLVEMFPSESGQSGLPSAVFGAAPAPLAPSDPGDAKVALASRRDVRTTLYLANLRREQTVTPAREDEASMSDGSDEGEVRCLCRGTDDGRSMVRCDGCKTWSHQTCVGIEDETDLGDSWFCPDCASSRIGLYGSVAPAELSPILVQADDVPSDPPPGSRQSALASSQRVAFASPPVSPTISLAHSSPVRGHPRTPKVRGGRRREALDAERPPQTPRSWLDGSVFRTPRFPDDLAANLVTDTPFDPLGTPSRGTRYSSSFMSSATPLAARSSLLRDGIFATPKAPSHSRAPIPALGTAIGHHNVGSSPATLHDQSFMSPLAHHYSMSFQYNESPIQRSRPAMSGLAPAVSLTSPTRKNRKERPS